MRSPPKRSADWEMLLNFNVILIGAGEVNFGSVEGPWNHSLRLERKLKDRLQIIALVDPDIDRAKSALESKSKGDQAASYVNARIVSTISEASNLFRGDKQPK
ncbi:hypothetical protein M422DRAFT_265341 [Sphaerobolus stellatus SS14]|uniref:Uncharacterized protein n=1 Tax=Sphaerobolus stellatus (strain SS14) TaxID=990650 RepID=A0A0C9TRR0_SPHS4|nr:hypothetical protein M422DRAFT_265341 [Sphaerobolus stellatus SS14]